MKYWVYILKCVDGSYYTGFTSNLDHRVQQHTQRAGCLLNWFTPRLVILHTKRRPERSKLKAGQEQRKKPSFEGILMRWWNYRNPRAIVAMRLIKTQSNLQSVLRQAQDGNMY